MDQGLLAVTTAWDLFGHDEDVFCVVKRRVHNLHPNSGPSLVLPRQRCLAVPTRAPPHNGRPQHHSNESELTSCCSSPPH